MERRAIKTSILMILVLSLLITFACRSKSHSTPATYSVYASGGDPLSSTGTNTTTGTGGDPTSGGTTTTDPVISGGTITVINIVVSGDTGTGLIVDTADNPETVDFSNVANTAQLISTGTCTPGEFNRIKICFDERITLVENGLSSSCTVTSYQATGSDTIPDRTICENGICCIYVNGAVNLLAGQSNTFGLDFDLKNFEVTNFGDPNTCTVALKIMPLTGPQVEALLSQDTGTN